MPCASAPTPVLATASKPAKTLLFQTGANTLEAAHVYPYHGDQTNTPCNGLLLRADLHILFDLDLISIDPESLTVVVAKSLRTTSYSDLQGGLVAVPKDPAARPSKQALQGHFGKSGL